MKFQPYLVVGTGRSGTSTVARVLHEKLNVFMGFNLPKPAKHNPDGSWEDPEFSNLNKSLLYKDRQFAEWAGKVKELIEEREALQLPWGFKDPRISDLFGFYLQYFDKPKIILCERKKELVIESLQKCYNMSKDFALQFWGNRNVAIHRVLREIDHLVIDFDKTRKSDDEIAKEIMDKWDVKPCKKKRLPKKKLSVCMIVKNEEECLARCLDSIKGADELIIVDTGSTDKTVEIARKYTDKVYEDYKWNDSFAEARNHAKNKATSDWILTIDADEVLVKGSMASIRKAIEETTDEAIGASLEISDSGHKWYFPRLHKNKKSVFFVGDAHNMLNNIPYQMNDDIQILCYYSSNHKDDPGRTLRILEKTVKKNPNDARNVHYLGREYFVHEEYIKALYWLERYMKLDGWPAELAETHLFMARTLVGLGRIADARTACIEALKVNADFKEAIEYLAYLSKDRDKDRWTEFAKDATSKGVLVDRCSEIHKAYAISQDDWNFIQGILEKQNVKKVLEFGAGLSTLLMSETVEVLSFETDKEYGKEITKKDNDGKKRDFSIVEWDGEKIDTKLGQYDLAFIDGPCGKDIGGIGREASFRIAVEHADKIIVHDAGRKDEQRLQEKYMSGKFKLISKNGSHQSRCHYWVRNGYN